jgi:hypothetical protein
LLLWKPMPPATISPAMKAFGSALFDSDLLFEIASAIQRRGKAIRSHGKLKCTRELESPFERLNVDFHDILGRTVRLCVWSDGHLWLCVTQPGPRRTGGWALRIELRSHVAEFDGPEFCRRFFQTIHSPTEVRSFWPSFRCEPSQPESVLG